ncbi:MAG: glutamate--tRNA ligase [Patescibacteria group bacterium]|nr:glutamate--tRNA ligase [Patescibacteria group bacterium]
MTQIVTRIAPSPTGQMHIGTVRTALFNYIFAKQHGGTYFVRIEDTDKERSRAEWIDAIWKDFEWCGLTPDARYIQSEHAERHRELLAALVAEGKAYVSKEPSRDDPSRQVEVVRLKNPGTRITFTDLIRGDVSFDTAELGDFVIARAIDDPLYHFAVVVDDKDAGVTHIIRAEEHLSNTPRQILIQEALGFSRPQYAHIPLILAPDRTKLSKRKHAASLEHYRDEGYLPEAIINYLALLGWNPGTDEEHFSLSELVERFSLDRVQKSGAIFDETKLKSVNQHWMRKLSIDDFITRGALEANDSNTLRLAVPLLKERARTFGEARELLSGELSCLFTQPSLDKSQLLAKEPKDRPGIAATALKSLSEAVRELPAEISADGVKEALMPLADAEEARGKGGRGAVLWPLRYALSGQERSPDPFTLISILGPVEAASRVEKAVAILG